MKKNNYNFKKNPPKLSGKEIEKHKDFDQLLKQHQASGGDQGSGSSGAGISSTSIASIIIGIAAVVLVYFGPKIWNNNNQSILDIADRPYVDPPLEKIQAQFASFKMDASQGGIYEYGSGSKIIVPPNAFLDENGNEITGEINLKYREFHDFVDFFLSGIPMNYDSLGTNYLFESAGMMEINAMQQGKNLRVNPDKSIDVELVSLFNRSGDIPSFNIYQLDTLNKKWDYRGIDRIEEEVNPDLKVNQRPLTPEEVKLRDLDLQLKALDVAIEKEVAAADAKMPKSPEPQKPVRANKNSFGFDLEVEKNKFPDLAVYEKVKWQVMKVPSNQHFSKQIYEVEWDDAQIEKIEEQVYELTLTTSNRTEKFKVQPVLMGADYQKAMKEYTQKHIEYKQKFNARKLKLDEERAAIEKSKAAQRAKIKAEKKALEEELQRYRHGGDHRRLSEKIVARKIVNRFKIADMGVWNCDRPMPPNQKNCLAKFVDREGQQYIGNAVYHVDRRTNTVNKFYATGEDELRINVDSENLMWLVTQEGKIAIFNEEKFKQLDRTKLKETFTMDLVDQKINTEEDIRNLLRFN